MIGIFKPYLRSVLLEVYMFDVWLSAKVAALESRSLIITESWHGQEDVSWADRAP